MSVRRILFAAIIVAAAGALYLWSPSVRPDPQKAPQEQKSQTWETKTDEQETVFIKVTPLDFSAAAAFWKFQITFDTHTGALDDDPLQVVRLLDDKGKDYVPRTWDGPGPGGHHREGILTFRSISPLPKEVSLSIRSVGGVSERQFKWNLNN